MKTILGECTGCGEWTQVPGSCCGVAVRSEGHEYFDEDYQDDDSSETTDSVSTTEKELRKD